MNEPQQKRYLEQLRLTSLSIRELATQADVALVSADFDTGDVVLCAQGRNFTFRGLQAAKEALEFALVARGPWICKTPVGP